EQNQLAAAQQLCEDLLTEVSSSSATEAIATVHITLSRLLSGRQLASRAQRLLDQLLRILELGKFPRFVSQVAQESLRQALLAGKSAALEAAAQRFALAERLQAGEWDAVRPYEECWERYGLATAYWLIGRGNAGRAVRVLKVLAESLRSSEMHVRSLVVEVNLWLHNPELASDSQRVRALRQLVARYEVHNLTRTVLDEAPGFGPILAQLQQAGLLQIPSRYCELYAEFFQAGQVARQSLNPRAVLTDKELEVFHGLLAGWSNGEISQRAGIALSTTKWHLKNIYSKLQVASRTEAILAAREYIWPA
ncbi:MAG: helix-turn-helix transcriptional regulator, partial [Pseudomonas monteilii]